MQIIKLNRYFIFSFVFIAICIGGCFVISFPPSIILLVGYIIFWYINRNKIEYPHFLTSVFFIIHFFVVVFILNNSEIPGNKNELEQFMPCLITSITYLIAPFFLIYLYYVLKTGVSINLEKKRYSEKEHPGLICTKHYTRPGSLSSYDYKYIVCRGDNKCDTKKNFIKAKQLVGVIGLIEDDRSYNEEYFVNVWNHKTNEFKDGDYDVIEIHQNPEIEDYNSIINKVSNLLFNEIERYIPIFRIKVRIFGELNLSESTKRLLEEKFLKVEYFATTG